MDIRVESPEPSAAERAAVDAVLGPAPEPASRHGFHQPHGPRDLLLPALQAVQARVGWVSPEALGYICRRLVVPPAEAHAVASFYALLSLRRRPAVVAHVCDDVACRVRGGEALARATERALGPEGEGWHRSPCLGLCERAPAALVTAAGETPAASVLAPATVEVLAIHMAATAMSAAGAKADPGRGDLRRSVPQLGSDGLRLLRRVGTVDPASLEAYRQSGGYQALAAAVRAGRDEVLRQVTASRLAGRGGAAFPTGRKWEAVARAPERPHYLVCNADESEPGTFKDRLLLEEDPFAIVEGMTIAAYATGCERGYLYLRGEYPLAAERVAGALAAARGAGLLGADVMGAGFAFDLEVRRGAGAYVCGEETALFNSIEGKRGEPRSKPPFPVQAGLFGKPTVINNVETLANVPWIVLEGGAAYAALGTGGSTGTKLFCVSGHAARPGLYEVPFGTTLRRLLELAGGVREGRALRAILLGGAAGTFVGPGELDLPLTFEGTKAAGAALGSGVVVVLDDTTDLVDVLLRIAAFFRDESCGQCVPCRVGTVRQEELLRRLAAGRPRGSWEQELALLRELAQAMKDASICGLGQAAPSAVESALARLDPFGRAS